MNPEDKLYHGFALDDLDGNHIKIETIRFPDFSCNWARFSQPSDVRFRENGRPDEGAYAFAIVTARYNCIATAVHDPLRVPKENYSHVEVRELIEGESVHDEPPRNRKPKSKKSKKRRLEYRQNLLNSLDVVLQPGIAST